MLLMIYLCNLWFTYDLLMIYLWNGEGGCAYDTYEKYHQLISLMNTYVYLCYLFYLCRVLITCYTYTTYDLLMNYLWFTSEMGKWGVLIILTKNTIYLFYLWKLIITYSTYDISYMYVTYTWNASKNTQKILGVCIAVFSRRNWKYGGEETPSSAKYTSTTSNRTWWAIVSSISEIRNI